MNSDFLNWLAYLAHGEEMRHEVIDCAADLAAMSQLLSALYVAGYGVEDVVPLIGRLFPSRNHLCQMTQIRFGEVLDCKRVMSSAAAVQLPADPGPGKIIPYDE